jgi:rSAM/selenodomain-associated transferase 2
MISVVIPTLDAEEDLGRTLAALVPAAVEGIVREVIIVDGGSRDRTLEVADHAGAEIMKSEPGRGNQLKAGAARARFPWLLFLHADTVLEAGWERDVAQFIERVDSGRLAPRAAAFRFTLDDLGFAPRALETLVLLRTTLLKLPYGDQGLLIPRRLYDEIGGFKPLPVMEDVDIVRRLGRRRILPLRSRAVTSAARYRRDGYLMRVLRNQWCLMLYFLNVPASTIARIYGSRKASAPSPLPRTSAR